MTKSQTATAAENASLVAQQAEVSPIAPPNRTRHEWLVRIALVLFGLLVGLASIEVAFRFLPLDSIAKPPRSDRPGLFYTAADSPTMRDFNYAFHKPADTFRMVVVGDSLTFGTGLMFDDTFSKRLERILNLNKSKLHAEVLNYGVPGYSSADEVALVRHALKRNADLILVQITLNDAELRPFRSTHPWYGKGGEIILEHPIFHYWKSLEFVAKRILSSITHSEFREYFDELYADPVGSQRFRSAFRKMKQLADNRGVPLAGVVFPALNYPIDETYPFTAVHKHIHTVLTANKINYLDLTDSYRGMDNERLQILPGRDAHPNEIANRIASSQLYRWLNKQGLIPQELIAKNWARERRGSADSILRVQSPLLH